MKHTWKIAMGFLIVFILVLPVISLAQGIDVDPCDTSGKICNPIEADTLNQFIQVILEGFLKLAIPVIALAIIYSGFLFVAARGNPESLTKAKDTFFYTLIGAAILLGAWAIAKLISETIISLQ